MAKAVVWVKGKGETTHKQYFAKDFIEFRLTFNSYGLLVDRAYADAPFPVFWDKGALGSLITVNTCNVNAPKVFEVASPTWEPAIPTTPKPKQNKRKQRVESTPEDPAIPKPSYTSL